MYEWVHKAAHHQQSHDARWDPKSYICVVVLPHNTYMRAIVLLRPVIVVGVQVNAARVWHRGVVVQHPGSWAVDTHARTLALAAICITVTPAQRVWGFIVNHLKYRRNFWRKISKGNWNTLEIFLAFIDIFNTYILLIASYWFLSCTKSQCLMWNEKIKFTILILVKPISYITI